MMQFEGEFTVDGAPEELWQYFTDPDILRDAAPGCESMTLESPSQLTATLSVGVGSVKPSFDVDGVVVVADRPDRLEIRASGEASRNSFTVSAWQELHDNGDGTTTVYWEANARVSGIIASMGDRALGSVADKLVNDFFQELERHVNLGTPAESKLRAVSEDAAVADAEKAVSEPEAPEGGTLGETVGTAADALSGEGGPSTIVSFGAGVACGLAGAALWNRLRSRRGQASTGTEPQAEASGQRVAPGGGQSKLTVLLALALGAVSALLWSQRQRDVRQPAGGDSVGTDSTPADAIPATTDTADTTPATTETVDTTSSGPRESPTDGTNGTQSAAGTDEERGDPFESNPIDWLESR